MRQLRAIVIVVRNCLSLAGETLTRTVVELFISVCIIFYSILVV